MIDMNEVHKWPREDLEKKVFKNGFSHRLLGKQGSRIGKTE